MTVVKKVWIALTGVALICIGIFIGMALSSYLNPEQPFQNVTENKDVLSNFTPTQEPKTEQNPTPTTEKTPTPATEKTPIQAAEQTSTQTTKQIPTQATQQTPIQTTVLKNDYVVNISTKKFHLPSCGSAKNIKDTNREDVFDANRQEMLDKGYTPCGICKP